MRDRKNDSQHRQVAEAKLGRKLRADEVAHHLDEDKSNNAGANIAVQGRSAHSSEHGRNRGGLSRLRAALRMVKEGKKSY
jgi:hypothetical protein